MTNETNSLDLVPVIFAAGESRLFQLSGNYFELIDCPTPVDVVLSDLNGAQRTRMKSAEASFYSKDVDFATIQITSAGAQTVRFAYGTGEAGTRRSTGSVTVAGAIALDAATLLALETINNRPEAATGFYQSYAAWVANTAETAFTPAANVNGAILLAAGLSALCGAVDVAAHWVAHTAAPANISTGEVLYGGSYTAYGGGSTIGVYYPGLSIPQFIAPGKGLYFLSSGASTSTTSSRYARWRLL